MRFFSQSGYLENFLMRRNDIFRSRKGSSSDNVLIRHMLCDMLLGRFVDFDWDVLNRLNWNKVYDMMTHEGVAPLIYWQLQQHNALQHLPHFERMQLTQDYFSTIARNEMLRQELARITQALNDADVTFVILKGFALAAEVYPDFGLRPMGDLDLLVRREDIVTAVQVILRLGYAELDDLVPGMNMKAGYNIKCRHVTLPDILVEVHWSLLAGDYDVRSPSVDFFWVETQQFSPKSKSIVPSNCLSFKPEINTIYLAAHMMLQHGPKSNRLIWLYDVYKTITDHNSFNWNKFLVLTQQLKWEHLMYFTLYVVQDCFQVDVPNEVISSLSQLVQNSDHNRLDPDFLKQPRTRFSVEWQRLMALDWRTRVELTRAFLFPSVTYMAWRYPRLQTHSQLWLPFFYLYRWFDIAIDIVRTTVYRIREC